MRDTSLREVEVLIVGAGINGAGLFRDLSAQGVSCVIVDKGDFGSGTSAAPSRLIHGGLKYLETGEFGLVAQSTYERNLLLKNAAHLVKPLPTMIPLRSWTNGVWAAIRTLFGSTTAPRTRGAVLIQIGLAMYDFYGARARVMPRHRMLGRAAAARELPALTRDVVGLGIYYDAAVTAPERLLLELLEDGMAAHPGNEAWNWTAVTGQADGVVELTRPDGAVTHVRPGLVVNAGGPWIDRVNAALGIETKLIGGTKGAHVLLDHPELVRQLDGRMLYFESDDGRILLAFPYHGMALIGSTDIPADDPDKVVCEAGEVDYFMERLGALMPGLSFDAGQIVYTYSGIRPLPNSVGLPPRLISRDHSAPVEEPAAGRPFRVISLVGGKWTTFRGFAEEVADTILAGLGRARAVSTADLPIGGGRDWPVDDAARRRWIASVAAETGAAAERVAVLLDRYGTTAAEVARAEGAAAELILGTRDTSTAEIGWIAEHERVVHLEDILLRRTQLAISGQLDRAGIAAIAAVAAGVLGWDDARRTEEIGAAETNLETRHGVRLRPAAATATTERRDR